VGAWIGFAKLFGPTWSIAGNNRSISMATNAKEILKNQNINLKMMADKIDQN
jgi:hypothetical protein